LLFAEKDFVAAAEHYGWLTQHVPQRGDCHDRLGICNFRCGRYAAAAESLQRAAALLPKDGDICERWAQALFHTGDLDKAEVVIRRALQLRSDAAPYYYCLGHILLEQSRVPDAMLAFQRALTLQPDYREARWQLCHALLLSGRYDEGWQTDCWWDCDLKEPTHTRLGAGPAWDGLSYGEQILLVRWHRGYGDNFQCWRYLRAVKALGGTVIAEAPAQVQTLLQGQHDVDQVVPLIDDKDPEVSFDYAVSALDLPQIFKTSMDAIPSCEGVLRPPRAQVRQWAARLPEGGFKVGIVWAGNPEHGRDRLRSCPLTDWYPLLQYPGIEVYSLQKGSDADAPASLSFDHRIHALSDEISDFADTAAILMQMDLVISVDTAVLHLAATLGRPTWGLIGLAPDWRWHLARDDSPWYPTIRLFRQTERGNWQTVFDQVIKSLDDLLGE
jgi:tetratricopeptide (TPR) repeat protein